MARPHWTSAPTGRGPRRLHHNAYGMWHGMRTWLSCCTLGYTLPLGTCHCHHLLAAIFTCGSPPAPQQHTPLPAPDRSEGSRRAPAVTVSPHHLFTGGRQLCPDSQRARNAACHCLWLVGDLQARLRLRGRRWPPDDSPHTAPPEQSTARRQIEQQAALRPCAMAEPAGPVEAGRAATPGAPGVVPGSTRPSGRPGEPPVWGKYMRTAQASTRRRGAEGAGRGDGSEVDGCIGAGGSAWRCVRVPAVPSSAPARSPARAPALALLQWATSIVVFSLVLAESGWSRLRPLHYLLAVAGVLARDPCPAAGVLHDAASKFCTGRHLFQELLAWQWPASHPCPPPLILRPRHACAPLSGPGPHRLQC